VTATRAGGRRRSPAPSRRAGETTARARRGKRPSSVKPRAAGRPGRRRAARRRWIALLSVLTVAGIGYILLFTSMLGVRSVEVLGAGSLTPEQIREAADVPDQRAMLRLDTDEVRDRVLTLPGVASAEVSRSWPSTVEIVVTERTPVGFFAGGDGAHLVDRSGADFKTMAERPPGLPEVKVSLSSPADPVSQSICQVLAEMPPQLRERVASVAAQTPGSVELTLADGKIVRWGDAKGGDRKAKVLAALLTQPGQNYDVSSPELPTVS